MYINVPYKDIYIVAIRSLNTGQFELFPFDHMTKYVNNWVQSAVRHKEIAVNK